MINPEKLRDAGIDYDAGLERFMNDKSLYEAVLRAYIEKDIRVRAKNAFDSGNMTELMKIVHEQKGSSGNAGFSVLYKKASALVALMRSENYSQFELKETYGEFEEEYIKVFEAVKSALE